MDMNELHRVMQRALGLPVDPAPYRWPTWVAPVGLLLGFLFLAALWIEVLHG
jgi:hypothetical protein